MPKAFSYLRFSSAEQMRGDSERRQLERSRDYAREHRLTLDESLRDPGVSAYRGRNRLEGSLAQFLRMVQAGKVPRGSYFIVESLDRVTREQIMVALGLFTQLINAGIRIV